MVAFYYVPGTVIRVRSEDPPSIPELTPTESVPGADLAENNKVSALNRPVSPAVTILVLFLALVLGCLSLSKVDSGFLKAQSGPAPLVEINQYPRSPGMGEYYFTTVKFEEVSVLSLGFHYLSAKADELTPSAGGGGEAKAAAYAQMEQSKALAAQVAAQVINPNGSISTLGAKVLSVKEGSAAAASYIKPGDVIIQFNSVDVVSDEHLSSLSKSSESALIKVTRAGVEHLIEVDLSKGKGLGVQVMTEPESEIAFDISTGSVGGGSGGLMFTLAGIDALTGSDLTNGTKVAGTGTIKSDLTVGPVGGTQFKAKAAEELGAEVFFVPSADFEQANSINSASMKIVPVDNVIQAVDYLCSRGASSPVCD